MEIRIDGRPIEVIPGDRNIVDVCDRAGIGIPAPCYRSDDSSGCCRICVVDINGSQEYACCTAPAEGMNITVHRQDLKELRKQRIAEYLDNDRQGGPCDCDCSEGTSCCS